MSDSLYNGDEEGNGDEEVIRPDVEAFEEVRKDILSCRAEILWFFPCRSNSSNVFASSVKLLGINC